ncbi:MAG: tetratricopeptide repeat protein [Anaerolineae bacterium]
MDRYVATLDEQSDGRRRQGLAHLQAGEWDAAIDCFEELVRAAPQSDEIRQLLESARFRASLDAEAKIRPRRWRFNWRTMVAWVLVALATGAMALQVTRLVTQQIIPGITAAREARWQAQWLEEGRTFLERGELEQARRRFLLLEAFVPGHPEAVEALARIDEMRSLTDLYEQGVRAQDEGDFESALEAFREISHLSPGYRDVDERMAQIEDQQQFEALFAEAQRAYASGETLRALSAYEQFRQLNVSYERELVEGRLFELYMRAGLDIINSPQVDQLPQATDYFVQALALRPSSPEAALEHRLAGTCSEGLGAYDDGVWGRAIGRLRIVFDERPRYLEGEVAYTLYRAYLRLGEEYEKAGNFHMAHQQYQLALALPVDQALVLSRLASIVPRLTPTPTPTALPTQTPRPTRRPFTGDAVQLDRNLLTNPSFEGGWYNIYTGQVPDGWRFLWLDGVEFPGSADIALAPETVVGQLVRTPMEERSLLFLDGSRHLKAFKGFAPMYGALVQEVSGLDEGRGYRLVAPVFVDAYSWEGKKVPASGTAARVRLGAGPTGAAWRDETAITYSGWWDGTNTANFYLQYSNFVFDFVATQPDMAIYIELVGVFGLSNNGFFVDDVALYPLGTSSATPTPSG